MLVQIRQTGSHAKSYSILLEYNFQFYSMYVVQRQWVHFDTFSCQESFHARIENQIFSIEKENLFYRKGKSFLAL